MLTTIQTQPKKRGRKPKQVVLNTFKTTDIKLFRGSDLKFNDSLFKPIRTNRELDIILSSDGGLMPGTNMIMVGGPGSGKSTVVLDMLADFTRRGYKCLFVSGEMDEIAHYKYCKRLPKFAVVQTLFLKNYASNVQQTLEHVFEQGYDVVAIDSIAEVIEMLRDNCKLTESAAESWFLGLQDRMKKGENKHKYYTSFINIQQVTKQGDFVGSNRLKHMTDAMAHITKNRDTGARSISFSKNRDGECDIDLSFTIAGDSIKYGFN